MCFGTLNKEVKWHLVYNKGQVTVMYSGLDFNTFPFTMFGQNFAPFCKDLGFTLFLIHLTTIYFIVPGYQTA